MTNEIYKEYIKNYKPKVNKLKKEIIAFFIGGLIGLIAELLINFYMNFNDISYTLATNYMMITFIFFSCLFTGIGFFDDWIQKAGAGLFIPITGFAHATTASALDYKKEGYVFGIGSNIFKLSGSVILYGIVFSYIFGLVRYLFFGG